jgi:hypothetical protein
MGMLRSDNMPTALAASHQDGAIPTFSDGSPLG